MISIILPVYNTERYLPDTIDSILNQSYTDFELIAINDGSTDQSLSILKEYAEKDARVRLIDKPNSGVSDTRNRGISVSKGDYLCFIDADDIIAPYYLESLMRIANEHFADYVVCQYKTFHRNVSFTSDKNEQATVEHIISSTKLISTGLITSCWNKLIKKDIIVDDNIAFDKRLSFGEDMFFCWKCFYVAKNVWMTDQVLYGYRMMGESAINRCHPNLYEKYKVAFDELKHFYYEKEEEVLDEEVINIDVAFVKRLPIFLKMIIREYLKLGEKRKRIQHILNDETLRKTLNEKWDALTDGVTKKQLQLFRYAKDKKASLLMIKAYRTEIILSLKRMIKKIKS